MIIIDSVKNKKYLLTNLFISPLFPDHYSPFKRVQLKKMCVWCFYCRVKRLIEHFKGILFRSECICTNEKGGDMRSHKELYLVILGTFFFFTLVLSERVSNVLTFTGCFLVILDTFSYFILVLNERFYSWYINNLKKF